MARRRRQQSGGGLGAWVQGVGEQLGAQLGQIIAESLQRSLESSINVADIARRLGGDLVITSRPASGHDAGDLDQAFVTTATLQLPLKAAGPS